MNWNKRATHEYTSFSNPWTETSALHMNINSFFNPWTETSALHMNITRSLIHEPKQARHTSIYLVLLSMNRNKHATHEYTSFFNPWTEKSALHINIPRSLIHEPKQARYTYLVL